MKKVDFDRIFSKYSSSEREGLIPVLQEIQNLLGYISEDAIVKVSAYFNLPTSKVYCLSTFYDEFKFEPLGKFALKVCNGSACHVLGSSTLLEYLEKELDIKAGETTRDGIFSLIKVDCIGACAMAPVIMVNDKYYTNIEEEDLDNIIEDCRKTE
jgi:NADH-quinone oxidoreductase E subunit